MKIPVFFFKDKKEIPCFLGFPRLFMFYYY